MKTLSGRLVFVPFLAGVAIVLSAVPARSTGKNVTIALKGNNCNWYLDDVKNALQKALGVSSIKFNSSQDKAIVSGDPHKLKASRLVSAVNALKGDGWYCKVNIVK